MKNTKKALLTSALCLLLCCSMLIGTTFAWFTDEVTSAVNIIQSGTLDVDLVGADGETLENETLQFVNQEGKPLTGVLWEPGCTYILEPVYVANNGNLALKYEIVINGIEGDAKLLEAIEWTVEGASLTGKLLPNEKSEALKITGHMKEEAGNEYQGLTIEGISITVYATQLNHENDSYGPDYDKNAAWKEKDEWDGTVDTTWYNESETEFTLETAEELAGLAELVSGNVTFKGKTIKLSQNIDLYCEDTSASADGDPVTFRPIGDYSKNGTFEGVFDGQGYTISNLYQNGWDLGYEWGVYGSYGLFGNINNATIKNLTVTGAESYIEGGDVGGITGSATGKCVFENITIEDSTFATYNNGCGGIIAWSGEGEYTFKNVTISENTVLAGLWGSFDSSIGGIVGQGEPGATYNFENVNIACRIDAYNDCTASYDYYNYRMCGMIIGRLAETTTIEGANYPDTSKYYITCNNVTVTYGDWANYHYCDPTPGYNGGRGMRVEAGYAYDGLPTDYDHSTCTSHCKELIAFDQIFGGAQYAVKGLKTYEGVQVVYNNK